MRYLHAVFIFWLISALTSSAAAASQPSAFTPAESEVLLIPSLAKQGYLSFTFDDKGFFVRVEPLFWQKALHREKVELVKAAMATAHFMNREKHLNITTVQFFNMTTHAELAYGFIGPPNPGKYEILK